MVLPILASGGLTAGKDFFLAFSPEREDPGNPDFSAERIPKVVGGIDPESGRLADLLYSQAVARTVPVPNCEIAEAAKILENTYRSVNIAMVNELKMLFDRIGIDVWEVIEAARSKPFGFQAFYPGPGLGGHCIPIDPFYLSWLARRHGMATRFIELAGEINTSMPQYVIHRLIEALNRATKPLRGSKVCVLGVAYKRDVDDARESPSFVLMDLLREGGAVRQLQRPARAHLAADPPARRAGHAQFAADGRVSRRPGLHPHCHRPHGLRLRVYRAPRPPGGRYPQRHAEREDRPREDRQGVRGEGGGRKGEGGRGPRLNGASALAISRPRLSSAPWLPDACRTAHRPRRSGPRRSTASSIRPRSLATHAI